MAGLFRARLTGGSGEKDADAYFATMFLLRPKVEEVFLYEQPRIVISLLHERNLLEPRTPGPLLGTTSAGGSVLVTLGIQPFATERLKSN